VPDFIITDPAIKSTGLEAIEFKRHLQGYFQPQKHSQRDGENQEEMSNKTQSMTTWMTSSESFLEAPSLTTGK